MTVEVISGESGKEASDEDTLIGGMYNLTSLSLARKSTERYSGRSNHPGSFAQYLNAIAFNFTSTDSTLQ